MATLSLPQGQAAMDAISGQNDSSLSSNLVQTGQLFMSNFAMQASSRNRPGGIAASAGRIAPAEACEVVCDTATPARWGACGRAVGGIGAIDGNGNAGTVTYNLGGFAAGIDHTVAEGVRLGVTVDYASGAQWTQGFSGRAGADTIQTGLYGSFTRGPLYLEALAGYAYSDNQMTRQIAIPRLQSRTATGRTGANQFFGQIEGGWRFDIGALRRPTIPFAGLQGITATQNAFSESGAGALSLSVASQTTNSLRSILGAALGGAMDLGWRSKLLAEFKLVWAHEFAATDRPVTASFLGAPAIPFTTYGAAPQRDGVVIGLKASTSISEGASVYFRYEGEIQGNDNSHAGSFGVRFIW